MKCESASARNERGLRWLIIGRGLGGCEDGVYRPGSRPGFRFFRGRLANSEVIYCLSPWRACRPGKHTCISNWVTTMTLKTMLRALILGSASIACTAPAPQTTAPSEDAVAFYHPEVRLRKLHLVRPDLIHYPLSVEVVC